MVHGNSDIKLNSVITWITYNILFILLVSLIISMIRWWDSVSFLYCSSLHEEKCANLISLLILG